MSNKLITMDAETLMNTPMVGLNFMVEELLPQGLNLLAGSPKIGKSWLALWMCLQISKGELVWGFETNQCEVLYLCLEDSFSRIQDRLFKITDEAPATLHFAIMSETIENGLVIQIEDFLKSHASTRFVVIDTLQKIRDNSGSNANPYAKDYDDINALKSLADKHKIAILLIHHLRKTHDSDPLNMISGTSGISGATDTNFVLQKESRKGNRAVLCCTGRDIEQRELQLEFNKKSYLWELLDPIEKEENQIDEVIFILFDFIKSVSYFIGTATELAEKLNEVKGVSYKPAVLKKKIVKYIFELNKRGISYTDKRTYERRDFTLTYDSMTDMTDMTVETGIEPTLNLPSLPSEVSGTEQAPQSIAR